MKNTILTISVLLLILISSGCEQKSKTAMHKVHWDRDMCARCVMVVSDRMNTVQIKNPDTGKSYMFDDIGCATLWFEEEKIEWSDRAVIWINDNTTGKWIDARKAYYSTGIVTPMDFGFGAHQDKTSIKDSEEIIDYKEVVRRIRQSE